MLLGETAPSKLADKAPESTFLGSICEFLERGFAYNPYSSRTKRSSTGIDRFTLSVSMQ